MRVVLKEKFLRSGEKLDRHYGACTLLPSPGSFVRLVTSDSEHELGPVLFVMWEKPDYAFFYTPEGAYELEILEPVAGVNGGSA